MNMLVIIRLCIFFVFYFDFLGTFVLMAVSLHNPGFVEFVSNGPGVGEEPD